MICSWMLVKQSDMLDAVCPSSIYIVIDYECDVDGLRIKLRLQRGVVSNEVSMCSFLGDVM